MTRFGTGCVAMMLAFVAIACGGGGSGGAAAPVPLQAIGGSGTLLTASFLPQDPTPSAWTVSMARSSGAPASNLITIEVNITDTPNIYGASLDVAFDPALVRYVGHTAGELLESGGYQVSYQVVPRPGGVVVGATRQGAAPGQTVLGTMTLIELTFEAIGMGASSLTYSNQSLLDDSSPPQPITGLFWNGGTVTAS